MASSASVPLAARPCPSRGSSARSRTARRRPSRSTVTTVKRSVLVPQSRAAQRLPDGWLPDWSVSTTPIPCNIRRRMTRRQLATILVAALSGACASGAPSADVDMSTPEGDLAGADLVGAPAQDGAQPAIVDQDQDGIDDARELALARDYLPFISMSPVDECPRSGLVVRVRPHPGDATLVHILYDLLFEKDCGITSHVGDDEVFAITIDPTVPPPAGILAMRAISHQGTICQRISECGRCGGLTACETKPLDGKDWPAVWPSRNKHGLYVNHLV